MRYSLIIFLLVLFSVQIFAGDLQGLKKRIAVVDFEDRSGWGHNIGTGLADMLVTELVKSGDFMVIERQELSKILEEQGLGMSGVVTPQSAAQVGQVLGVELMVMGSVTEFGEKKSGIGGSIGRLGIGGKLSKKEARAAVDIRLVNTSTSEIILAEKAEGEDGSTGLDNINVSDIDFGNPTYWDNTMLGKASRKAIDKCVGYISKAMEKIPWQGKIIKADDSGTIYMKPGSAGGVKPGMEFAVYSKGEELIDPDTGQSLGSEESKIGRIKVAQDIGDGKACKAIVVSGSGFKAGDLVREK
jgi:curli biogenesis system outer membrane secretion channel CsgG